jgi:hypothetical protein
MHFANSLLGYFTVNRIALALPVESNFQELYVNCSAQSLEVWLGFLVQTRLPKERKMDIFPSGILLNP